MTALDFDVGYVRHCYIAAISDRALLWRTGRLRQYCHAISLAAGNGCGELEASVCIYRKIVAAVVLQHQSPAASGKVNHGYRYRECGRWWGGGAIWLPFEPQPVRKKEGSKKTIRTANSAFMIDLAEGLYLVDRDFDCEED